MQIHVKRKYKKESIDLQTFISKQDPMVLRCDRCPQ